MHEIVALYADIMVELSINLACFARMLSQEKENPDLNIVTLLLDTA
jgi:hypothetical protein